MDQHVTNSGFEQSYVYKHAKNGKYNNDLIKHPNALVRTLLLIKTRHSRLIWTAS